MIVGLVDTVRFMVLILDGNSEIVARKESNRKFV